MGLALLEYLRELNLVSVCLRFVLAVLCGGVIGLNQGRRHQAAGLRTHMLVCVGAASTMIVNQYLFLWAGHTGDPARLGAQVISGIGFLGAGTIIFTGKSQVRGLTTAAGLWASACMGLAVGVGYFEAALVMLAALYFVLILLNRWDETRVRPSTAISLYLEFDSTHRFSSVLKGIHKLGWRVSEFEWVGRTNLEITAMRMVVQTDHHVDHAMVLSDIRDLPGVMFAEEL